MTLPPRVWRNVDRLAPELETWVQQVATRHYEEGSGEAELSTDHYPLCASLGPVRAHVDEFDGAEQGKRIFGLVVRSDRHFLHSASLCGEPGPHNAWQGRCCSLKCGGFELEAGDFYSLDPLDRHWTTCAAMDSELIFVATFLEYGDERFNDHAKIAHDLKWETLKARIEALRAERQATAEEAYRYRTDPDHPVPEHLDLAMIDRIAKR